MNLMFPHHAAKKALVKTLNISATYPRKRTVLTEIQIS